MPVSCTIRPATPDDRAGWLRLRNLLWPSDDHPGEIDAYFAIGAEGSVTLVLVRPQGGLGGFVEIGQRAYAEGCSTSPVAYIEGLFVDADLRRQGHGRRLVEAARAWAIAAGHAEMASDALIGNAASLAFHARVGFAEIERQVCFAMPLAPLAG